MTGLLMVNCAFGQVKLGAFLGRYPNRNSGLDVEVELDVKANFNFA
jgi:hypothetical protein